MSGRLVGEVLEYAPRDLTSAQLIVLVSLAEAARERDRTARIGAGLPDLERRTRLKVGSVKNALTELKKRGLIRPLFTARIGTAQAYQLARLQQHHRFLTVHSLPPTATPDTAPDTASDTTPTTPHLRAVGGYR